MQPVLADNVSMRGRQRFLTISTRISAKITNFVKKAAAGYINW
jgi:hypothetical protein